MSKGMIEGFAAATGAIAAALVTHPLSTLSTVEAVRPRVTAEEVVEEEEHVRPSLFSFNTVLDALPNFRGAEGWERFYDGLEPVLIGSAMSHSIYSYFYSAFKRMTTRNSQRSLSTREAMGVAYLAGFINALLTNPIWVIATRMQWRRQEDRSMWSAIVNAHANNGNQWILKGLAPSLVMALNLAIRHAVYEIVTGFRKGATKKKSGSSMEMLVSTAVSELISTFATYPLFLIKSRLQARESLSEHGYQNFTDALVKTFREEGLIGFYNGLSVKCIHNVLFTAIMTTIKDRMTETIMSLLKKRKSEHDV